MTDAPQLARKRRTRVVALSFALLNAGAIAATFWLSAAAEPPSFPGDGASLVELTAAAKTARDSHPFGALLVPYEHRELVQWVDAAERGDREHLEHERPYIDGSVRVFHIVLGEMSLLLAAMYALGLIGALMALSARPGWVIAGATLMLLAAPVPIVSVGPESALLTSYLFAGGVLLLIVKPRIARTARSPGEAEAAGRDARGMIFVGIGLMVFGGAGLALAVALEAARAKLWIGVIGCLVFGLVMLIWGIVANAAAKPVRDQRDSGA